MRQSPVAAGSRFGSRLGLLVAVSAAAIGVIYGYDTGVVAGALLFVPKQFHLSTAETSSVATAVALGMIVGALLASRVADAIGRKRTMVTVAAGYVAFAALSGTATDIYFLDVARFFLGITIGLSLVTAPVFIAESSPPRIRGSLIVSYQVATVAGIMSAYFIDYGLATAGAWRWMFALSALPAAAIGLLLLRLPDTPRWYAMRNRWEDAARTLRRIDPDMDVDAELTDIRAALRAERGGSVREMLRRPYLRATVFVVGLGFLIQITGINAIIYFTPLIFKQLGLTGNVSLLLVPGLIQAAALLATLAALRIVDRVGRRVVLLTGIGAMIVANALLIAVFAVGLHGGSSVLAFLGILLFTCGFDFGFGALVWVYASESFPARLRTTGASAMLTADLVGNLLIAQFFLSVLGAMGGAWTFTMFLVLAAVSFGYVWWLAPETKGRPLESIRGYWENGGRWPSETAAQPPARHAAADPRRRAA
jgi:MFS transporter, SP family, galactose:H+ symporter